MRIRFRHCLLPSLLAFGGCTFLHRDPGDASMLRPVSASSDDAPETDEAITPRTPAGEGWADRQRAIFERAWREIRQDLEYDTIDSFGSLDGQARRDVLAMREDLASDRGRVGAGRRPARD